MGNHTSFEEKIKGVDRIYREFLGKLALLKKEQKLLIKEYRTKLEQKKLSRLRNGLGIK